MNDDSLDDVANFKCIAANSGNVTRCKVQCDRCKYEKLNTVGIKAKPTGDLNVYAKEVWNEAIEAAALYSEDYNGNDSVALWEGN